MGQFFSLILPSSCIVNGGFVGVRGCDIGILVGVNHVQLSVIGPGGDSVRSRPLN